MRGTDWKLAMAVKDHWQGKDTPGITLCPLLADVDRLLAYLDDKGLKPGHSVACCPECGNEHRWALLKTLMCSVLDFYPARHTTLLEAIDKALHSVHALYGGKEKYQAMTKAAEAYFAKLDSDNCNTP